MDLLSSTSRVMQDELETFNECSRLCKEMLIHCIHMEGAYTDPEHLELLVSCAKVSDICVELIKTHSKAPAPILSLYRYICEACAEDCALFDDKHMNECAAICLECATLCTSLLSLDE